MPLSRHGSTGSPRRHSARGWRPGHIRRDRTQSLPADPAGRDLAPLPRLPARQLQASPRRKLLRGDDPKTNIPAHNVFFPETG